MTRIIQTAEIAHSVPRAEALRRKLSARLPLVALNHQLTSLIYGTTICLLCGFSPALQAQGVAPTGPQQLSFAGLRAVSNQGQINAVQIGGQGDIYLLIDQKDGVLLQKSDPTATNVLAQAQIGTKGDTGLAMALDPAGNVYVTGTTSSGALAATWAQLSPRFRAPPSTPSSRNSTPISTPSSSPSRVARQCPPVPSSPLPTPRSLPAASSARLCQ